MSVPLPCTVPDGASSYNRYKATIICQEVAKAKNVCQVCLLDLEYGIPVQARDTALGIEDESLPESDVGKEFKLKQLENEGQLASSYLKVRACSRASLYQVPPSRTSDSMRACGIARHVASQHQSCRVRLHLPGVGPRHCPSHEAANACGVPHAQASCMH